MSLAGERRCIGAEKFSERQVERDGDEIRRLDRAGTGEVGWCHRPAGRVDARLVDDIVGRLMGDHLAALREADQDHSLSPHRRCRERTGQKENEGYRSAHRAILVARA